MFIRPALDPAPATPGARYKVRDPVTMQFLADEGEEKPASDYWLRHQLHGGVEAKVDGEWPLPLSDNTENVAEATHVQADRPAETTTGEAR